jgi:hypothetical protein
MARTGPDGPTGRAWPADRAWPAAVALGLALVAGAYLLALVPALVLYGHGEDALALLALVGAVRLAGRGRWAAAGLALGVAVASKQWALLALPALVAWSPRRERPRLEHRVVLQLDQAPVHPHGRLGPGGQVQVGGALLEHLLEQLGHPDPALRSLVPQPHPGRARPYAGRRVGSHPARVGLSHQSLGLHAPLLPLGWLVWSFVQIGAASRRLEEPPGQVPRRQARR